MSSLFCKTPVGPKCVLYWAAHNDLDAQRNHPGDDSVIIDVSVQLAVTYLLARHSVTKCSFEQMRSDPPDFDCMIYEDAQEANQAPGLKKSYEALFPTDTQSPERGSLCGWRC